MHIILAILGFIVTILVLLNRLAEAGIDLGGLNPFLWKRRRKWREQYDGNALFQIESPMDAAGILLVGAVKADGDISIEEKRLLQELFETEFNLGAKDAAGLFISSSHLIGNGAELRANISGFLKPSKENFTEAQAKFTLELLEKVTTIDDSTHPAVKQYVEEVNRLLQPQPEGSSNWETAS